MEIHLNNDQSLLQGKGPITRRFSSVYFTESLPEQSNFNKI